MPKVLEISEFSKNSEKIKYSEQYLPVEKLSMTNNVGCCKVHAVVTIDSKGQIVLPKDVREKAKLKPNDKLAVIGCERNGEICCIMMVRADDLGNTVKTMLGPMLKEIFK
jgi:AbrB family looped-hinge helix DNA binding protein